ncbi:MAG: shikimate kinase AroK [Gammaproteobacteria bacterium]|nr:shikimate kinase AroK [Gammaproteobacteria bacterium]MDH5692630.1 shikimate kinase AroK [Gammaproteobacteria bacterium]
MRTEKNSNIYLVGPMGAGKTTIGSTLAKQLRRRFYDSDQEIEIRTGAKIPLIFELEGEEGFRKRETQVIKELTDLEQIVLATGGGAVLAEENRIRLKDHGMVIYLHADIEQLYTRTSKDNSRPLLNSADPKQVLKNLMDVREPLYREVADHIVNTGDKPISKILKEVLQLIS